MNAGLAITVAAMLLGSSLAVPEGEFFGTEPFRAWMLNARLSI